MDLNLHAFKVEGRAKSVYYLANVVGSYRQAIDWIINKESDLQAKLDYLYKELEEKLYHRGYTDGFMFNKGKLAQNLDNAHNHPDWEFCGQVISSVKKGDKYLVSVKVHNTMQINDDVEIIRPYYDIIKMKLTKMIDSETKEEKTTAHGGGGGQVIILETMENVPELSVLRRKVVNRK
jgi:putative protease